MNQQPPFAPPAPGMMQPPRQPSFPMQMPSKKVDSRCQLFVSQIPLDVHSPDLFELFSGMGNCKINMFLNRSRVSQSATITYDAPGQAEAALEKFRTKKVNGHYLTITKYEQDRAKIHSNEGNLFIRDLPRVDDFKMESLYQLLRAFGEIYSMKVGFTSGGKSAGYAFVRYRDVEVAAKLLEMEKIEWEGSVFTVEKYRERDPVRITNNLFVKNFRSACTEADIKKCFETYGEILSLSMKEGQHGKMCFVCFKNAEDAQKAISELHGKKNSEIGIEDQTDPRLLYVQEHQKKSVREIKKLRDLELFKKQWQKHNIYVKFIPQDWDEERLKAEFAVFGEIKSLKIVKKQGQDGLQSTGVGYVCFKDVEAARGALEGIKERNSNLYVNQFESKEARVKNLQRQKEQPQNQMEMFMKMMMALPGMMGPGGMNLPHNLLGNPRGGMMGAHHQMRGRGDYGRGGRGGHRGHRGMPPSQPPPQPHNLIQPPPQPNRMPDQGPPMQGGMMPPSGMRGGFPHMRGGMPGPAPHMHQHPPPQHQAPPEMMGAQPGVPMAMGPGPMHPGAPMAHHHQPPPQAHPMAEMHQGPPPQHPHPGIDASGSIQIEYEAHLPQLMRIKEILEGKEALEQTEKQEVGEILFNIFLRYEQNYAPKVTGMLLEIPAPTLMTVINTPQELQNLFQQAIAMLRQQEGQA